MNRTGRRYALDRDRTLPPLALTPEEAPAITVGPRSAAGTPFAGAAARAARKVLAGLPTGVRDAEERLAGRLHRVGEEPEAPPHSVEIVAAVAARRVLKLAYADGEGRVTVREVEPLSLLWGPAGWYLVAWCRLREAVRGFRLDRIAEAAATGETAPVREIDLDAEFDRVRARPIRD